jgi:FKBP-type peptidyl-prolyl cis-trans isomerase
MKKSLGLLSVVAFLLGSCLKQETPGPTFEEQLKKDIATIDAYLVANGINAVKDSSGVRYVVTKVGTGKKPRIDSMVYLNYKASVISNGNVILDTKDAYAGAILNSSNSSFYCWQLILPNLNRGSSLTIYSPSGYAYGTASSSDGTTLPANSNMIFDVKILDEVEQFKIDTAAIASYLTTNNLTAATDPSGLRYEITFQGTGDKPNAGSTVTFNYTGKFLPIGSTFDKSTTPTTRLLSNLIKGFQIGFPLLPTGSKATFYIPSALGYGPPGTQDGTIPSNSNLIFEVELVSFK